MTADRVPLLASVDRTVAAATTEDADAALVHLAQLYAAELDGASARRRQADRVAAAARAELGDESALYEEVEALRAALSERTALLSLGKALHAALAELGATPKARGAKAAPAKPGGSGNLHALRGGLAVQA